MSNSVPGVAAHTLNAALVAAGRRGSLARPPLGNGGISGTILIKMEETAFQGSHFPRQLSPWRSAFGNGAVDYWARLGCGGRARLGCVGG